MLLHRFTRETTKEFWTGHPSLHLQENAFFVPITILLFGQVPRGKRGITIWNTESRFREFMLLKEFKEHGLRDGSVCKVLALQA